MFYKTNRRMNRKTKLNIYARDISEWLYFDSLKPQNNRFNKDVRFKHNLKKCHKVFYINSFYLFTVYFI